MVKALVTKDCASHHTNPSYETLLILFEGNERNVRPYGWRGNWQPTDAEVMGLVKRLAELSPTFAEKLVRYALSLDTWTGKTHTGSYNARSKGKPITDLAELLL